MGRLGKQAGQAGSPPGEHRQGGAVAAHDRAVAPRYPKLHRDIVQQVACFEVVGSIEDHIEAGKQLFSPLAIDVRDDALDSHVRIDELELAFRGYRFGQVFQGVRLVKERLTLEITWLDKITVDDPYFSDTGPR